MKTRKGIFVTVLALLLVAAVSLAAGGDDAKEHWAKLKQELTLTDSQVTQLQQKFEEFKVQNQALVEKAKGLWREIEELEKAGTSDHSVIDAKKAELAPLKKEWKDKSDQIYRSVLSKEQFVKLQEIRAREEKEYSAKKKKD